MFMRTSFLATLGIAAVSLAILACVSDNAFMEIPTPSPTPEADAIPLPSLTPSYQAYSGPAPDFGPNVYIYGPDSRDFTAIDTRYAGLHYADSGQFSHDRVAFLFLPGAYRVDIPVGYYTQVLGLGRSPEDVYIKGNVRSDAVLSGGNATCNFWRAIENCTIEPTQNGRMKWAVAQATPFRRMKVLGDLNLADSGSTPWSSGGFIANSLVTGTVRSLSQQQWLSRNSSFGSWTGGNWNMAFMGVAGAPAEGPWSKSNPIAVKSSTPLSAEKPFIFVDSDGWKVFVPVIQKTSASLDWSLDPKHGVKLPISDFYIAKATSDTADSLNAALATGKNLILCPGIYSLNKSLEIKRPGTIVLGLGFATLIPQNGIVALKVADIDGARIAGIMIDAGTENSPTLAEIGAKGSKISHQANPIILNDFVARVGNGSPGQAESALTVNSNDVLMDHTWLWVADHDAKTFPLSWQTNPSKNGLIVNGDRVSAYGLFVEHFQEYQTIWNGNDGAVYMYQSELPYYAAASWSSAPGVSGYASYKVADSVKTHYGWALGTYMVFGQECERAYESPKSAGIHFDRIMTAGIVNGGISHVINDIGPRAGAGGTAYVTVYPE